MRDIVFGQVRSKLSEFRRDAAVRRKLSQADIGADALDYCAAEVEQLLTELEKSGNWLSVEEYSDLKLVTPQTVRNWIRRGELAAERTAKGYRISRGAERRSARKGAGRRPRHPQRHTASPRLQEAS